MKKSMFVAAALAAALVSSSASALDTGVVREIRSAGLPVASSLGTVSFTALGASGADCLYLTGWESPFNPNDVKTCILRERRTDAAPSCAENRLDDLTTFVSAGPGAAGGATACSGFDTLGVSYDDITISAGEFAAAPILQGVAVLPTALPIVHAIEVA
jgi:hypothetical protein